MTGAVPMWEGYLSPPWKSKPKSSSGPVTFRQPKRIWFPRQSDVVMAETEKAAGGRPFVGQDARFAATWGDNLGLSGVRHHTVPAIAFGAIKRLVGPFQNLRSIVVL